MKLIKYKIKMIKIMAIILAFFVISGVANAQQITDTGPLEASLDVNVNLIVEGCNNNAICEISLGETLTSCPADCTPVTPTSEETSETTNDSKTPSGHRNEELTIENLIAISTFSDIAISFLTNKETITSIKIGKTLDYELLTSIENSYRYNHLFVLNNLDSNTKYFYEIKVFSRNNETKVLRGSVLTKSLIDIFSDPIPKLQTPNYLKTITGNKVVTLTWQNPQLKSFDFIRVMKTIEKESPSPLDGELIYEGKSNILTDAEIEFGNRYFYTLFAKYKDGSFSEGISIGALVEEDDFLEKEKDLHKTVFGNEKLSIFDFSFTQSGKSLIWKGSKMFAPTNDQILVRLRKKDFFGPIEKVFLEATFYNENGNVSYRNIYKLVYNPALASYEVLIDKIDWGQIINFDAYIIYSDNTREQISGAIIVEKKGSIEAYNLYEQENNNLFLNLFNQITNAFKTNYPWPYILLFALLAMVAWSIRELLSKLK